MGSLSPNSGTMQVNAMLRFVLDNSNDAICLVDREARLLTFNLVLKKYFSSLLSCGVD